MRLLFVRPGFATGCFRIPLHNGRLLLFAEKKADKSVPVFCRLAGEHAAHTQSGRNDVSQRPSAQKDL